MNENKCFGYPENKKVCFADCPVHSSCLREKSKRQREERIINKGIKNGFSNVENNIKNNEHKIINVYKLHKICLKGNTNYRVSVPKNWVKRKNAVLVKFHEDENGNLVLSALE